MALSYLVFTAFKAVLM